MDDTRSLIRQFATGAYALDVSSLHQEQIIDLLRPLLDGSPAVQEHFKHSIRVGLLAAKIANFCHHHGRTLFIAGTLHDVGKCEIPIEVLEKTVNWTVGDAAVMEHHVIAGYNKLRGHFDFSAEIILWHHKFQHNEYPETLPPHLHQYSAATVVLIAEYGRLLALADSYDALHRPNDKFDGVMSGDRIKALMLEHNPDRTILIERLYQAGIFTT